MQHRTNNRALIGLLVLMTTGCLCGCGKSEVNQASPPLSPTETARNEPAPKNDDGTPKPAANTGNEPGAANAPAGPGEIVGRDRSSVPGGQ